MLVVTDFEGRKLAGGRKSVPSELLIAPWPSTGNRPEVQRGRGTHNPPVADRIRGCRHRAETGAVSRRGGHDPWGSNPDRGTTARPSTHELADAVGRLHHGRTTACCSRNHGALTALRRPDERLLQDGGRSRHFARNQPRGAPARRGASPVPARRSRACSRLRGDVRHRGSRSVLRDRGGWRGPVRGRDASSTNGGASAPAELAPGSGRSPGTEPRVPGDRGRRRAPGARAWSAPRHRKTAAPTGTPATFRLRRGRGPASGRGRGTGRFD